ncbi:MAG: 4Fe-4S binding protein [Elusimicrobiota bacterium]
MVYIIVLALLAAFFYIPLSPDICAGPAKSRKKARVLCGRNDMNSLRYLNLRDCNIAFNFFGRSQVCPQSCLGLYSCLKSCTHGAIEKDLSINAEKCIGCGICVEVCPLDLIIMVEKPDKIFVACSTSMESSVVKKICREGCVKCYVCMDACLLRAIAIDDRGLPVIDKDKCNSCLVCMRKCPTGAIRTDTSLLSGHDS